MRRLPNPFIERGLLQQTYPGSRLLKTDLGLTGKTLDLEDGQWMIIGVYAPIPGRHIGGLRVRLLDEEDFVSFLNQRDLEVVLGMGKPGEQCRWLGEPYPSVKGEGWIGLFSDPEDLADDLHAREMELFAAGLLTVEATISRKVHITSKREHEDYYVFDPYGAKHYPELSVETVLRRWKLAERIGATRC